MFKNMSGTFKNNSWSILKKNYFNQLFEKKVHLMTIWTDLINAKTRDPTDSWSTYPCGLFWIHFTLKFYGINV